MRKIIFILFITNCIYLQSCNNKMKTQNEVQSFLEEYNRKYQELITLSSEAEWQSNTIIIEGDSTNARATEKAKEELAKFTGSSYNIDKVKQYLSKKEILNPLQIKQLERILYMAANNPESIKEVVKERIKAETAQVEKLFGYDFKIDNKSVTANDIDEILSKESDLSKRLKAWEASKEVGRELKEGLVKLRDLRNKTVQGLDYTDFYTYQVSDYGMSTKEMMDFLKKINKEIYPIYRELHTYARYELAKKYNVKEVPDMIPAHWLSNRWGQDWSDMIEVEGLNLDSILRTKTPEWIVEQSERFYMSIGFDSLPKTFWNKSSLYPIPADAAYKKNNHASAWHMNYDKDVRSLMSVIPNTRWYETSHHELGHIYYYLTYSNPDVPVILREGANRAYHEAMGSLMGLAAMQKPFLSNLNLLPANTETDQSKQLLKDALHYIVFIPWSAGVMSEYEHDLYAKKLSPDEFNKRWWDLVKKYQGIIPPTNRGEEYCDAASKTHISDDAAQYYDYALSYIILFQLHDYISTKILNQDPHATNYHGNKEVGNFIKEIMYPGASKDWRKVLKEKTGEELSARAMLKYFEPLTSYLKKVNEGRKYTLPEL